MINEEVSIELVKDLTKNLRSLRSPGSIEVFLSKYEPLTQELIKAFLGLYYGQGDDPKTPDLDAFKVIHRGVLTICMTSHYGEIQVRFKEVGLDVSQQACEALSRLFYNEEV